MWIDPKKKRVDRSNSLTHFVPYIKALLEVVNEFLVQLDYTKTAFYTDMENMKERKEDLRKAFSVHCASQLGNKPNVIIGNPLGRYVYIADVYEDAYSIAFTYAGEVEHQFGFDFDDGDNPYNTNEEMWREDFLLAHQEYMS